MSRLKGLKIFIHQRLTAAVEEIFGHLEKTITNYEEEMDCRLRELPDTVLDPEMQRAVYSADVQQHLVIKEEISCEHQKWSPSLIQEHQEHPHIKEEKEGFWTRQEDEKLQGLQKDDMTKFLFTHVPVQNDDEEKAQLSQLHQRQTEENRESEPPASSSTEQMRRTEVDGEGCGGPETARISVSCFKWLSGSDDKTSHSSEVETEDNDGDWKETKKPQTDLNTMKNKVTVNNIGCNTGNKLLSCSKCGRSFGQKHHLQTHMRCHTGEKPFSCSLCGKRFTQKGNLTKHLSVHTREKPCSCSVCGERFAQRGNLTQHMTVHTREKLCW
ncbi:zinc finger protein 200-like isoform X1 [Thunnus thynnus]|uniref:hypermethylated in cancer 2 protein-like isoform X1 n=1 Tax=Thunnus maccoyii TaxID=8240 RepID=UPI001C4CB6F1|nr:hypermethylated in cancer 2 protein-like isoform X1 [Thunnus maccoyii]